MSNKFYPSKLKNEVLMAYKNEDYSVDELTAKYGINRSTLYNWVEKYEKYGISGFEDAKTWKLYTKELKEAAVKDYISGEYSDYAAELSHLSGVLSQSLEERATLCGMESHYK